MKRSANKISEHERLEEVSKWFSTATPGFDNRLTIYSALSLKKYFHGSSVLEVGSADGQMTGMLIDHFSRVEAVEGSRTYYDKLKKKYNNSLILHHSLIEDFEIEEKFDTILLAHILEHLKSPISVLKRVSKWLETNGRIIIAVPNANSIHRLVAVKMGILGSPDQYSDRDIKLGHRRVYTLEKLSADIHSAGLTISETGGIFFKPLTNKQIDETFTEEMMDGFYKIGNDFPEYAAEIFAICQKK